MKKITLFVLLLMSRSLLAQDVKVLDLETNDVVYLASTDRLYVSTSEGVAYGNSLCVVNPYHGTIDTCFFIGHSPGIMAVSDDEKFIYIGLETSPEIVRFNVENTTIGLRIPLSRAENPHRPYFAEDMAVVPGSPHIIAVALKEPDSLPHHAGIAIYENEVMRPLTLPAATGSNSITFDTQTGFLYGYRNETNTEYLIRQMKVTDNGVEVEKSFPDLLDRPYDQIKYADGKLYAHFGKVISLSNNIPALEGRFEVGVTFPVVEPLIDSNKVMFLNAADAAISFQVFDKNTLTLIDQMNFPNIRGNPYKLIHWSGEGIAAFITRDYFSGEHSRLAIMRSCTSSISDAPVVGYDGLACKGDTVRLYAEDPIGPVFWSNGQTGPEAKLVFSEVLFCSIADENGCLSPASSSILVSFYEYPALPVISFSEDSQFLYSPFDYGFGMQWFLNGEPIEGADAHELEYTEPGIYTFQVNWGGCLSELSNELAVMLTDVKEPFGKTEFQLFPNPATEVTYIRLFIPEIGKGTIFVSGLDGKVLRSFSILPGQELQEIYMAELPSGLYLIQVFDESGRRLGISRVAKL